MWVLREALVTVQVSGYQGVEGATSEGITKSRRTLQGDYVMNVP